MSNALAIAACTATLRNLLLAQIPFLDSDLSDLEVTTQPLDLARKNVTKAQLNLFLYQTVLNGAWRNLDMPRQVRPGETGAPALALNLHYLITAYGRGESDNDSVSHRVLGGAMSVLHDHPLLSRGEISAALTGNDLGEQLERLKITPLATALEDMSKLWMVFQTQYRISAAYEVTVLLIDSRAPVRTPLPVLQRGEGDRGVATVAGLAPTLREIRPPNSQPAARLGEDIAIAGEQLTATDAIVRFTSSRLAQPLEILPTSGAKPGELLVHLPSKTEDANALSRWAPGFYTVALVVKKTGAPAMASNEVAFALAPQITVSPTNATPGTVNLTLTCEPRILTGQRVLLLFGDRQVEPDSVTNPIDTTQPTTLAFTIPGVGAESYVVRLRVDGVDSIPVVYSGTPPVPSFDPLQKVTVA
ncbi:MAG: DUF4255 domain-containing protein [Betaproteobacteria bacterium]|nr:DUF4255 domain-containing protein [Betaproteobacteria bacterium]MDH3437947.1 DUF4255 domain-containing protein [Betaproteobacteria bacterium]